MTKILDPMCHVPTCIKSRFVCDGTCVLFGESNAFRVLSLLGNNQAVSTSI